jgi:hypothetical protein
VLSILVLYWMACEPWSNRTGNWRENVETVYNFREFEDMQSDHPPPPLRIHFKEQIMCLNNLLIYLVFSSEYCHATTHFNRSYLLTFSKLNIKYANRLFMEIYYTLNYVSRLGVRGTYCVYVYINILMCVCVKLLSTFYRVYLL